MRGVLHLHRGGVAAVSITVRTHFEKATVHLDNFTKDDRNQIVAFFRERFDHGLQENWSRFEQCVKESQPPASRRIIILSAVLTCYAAIFVCFWLAGLGKHNLIVGIANAVMAVWNLSGLRSARNRETTEAQD